MVAPAPSRLCDGVPLFALLVLCPFGLDLRDLSPHHQHDRLQVLALLVDRAAQRLQVGGDDFFLRRETRDGQPEIVGRDRGGFPVRPVDHTYLRIFKNIVPPVTPSQSERKPRRTLETQGGILLPHKWISRHEVAAMPPETGKDSRFAHPPPPAPREICLFELASFWVWGRKNAIYGAGGIVVVYTVELRGLGRRARVDLR